MSKRITDKDMDYERWLLKEESKPVPDGWIARKMAAACIRILLRQHDAAIRASRKSKEKKG